MKKKTKHSLIFSAIILALSIAAATTAILGWFVSIGSTQVDFFSVSVMGYDTSAEFLLDYEEIGSELMLNNLYPTKQYRFEIILKNEGDEQAYCDIYFSGLSDNLSDYGIELDMTGIFAVKREGEQTLYYFREIERDGRIYIYENSIVPPNQNKSAIFYLIFNDSYMYEDGTITNQSDIIDQFQNKVFRMNNLKVEFH